MASIYIHIPFCERKCVYCDFYSIPRVEFKEEWQSIVEKFISSLKIELDIRLSAGNLNQEIETIYFGGGTPSILQSADLERIMNLLMKHTCIHKGTEITIEVNPGTVDKDKLLALKSMGINRISLGIQSFYDTELKLLGRIHNSEEAIKSINDVYETGFENVNFDMIFALPNQSLKNWQMNLDKAIDFRPSHISCYNLSIEPYTPLYWLVQDGKIKSLDTEIEAGLYEYTIAFLTSHGYKQYEVSNFAKEDFKCRHNLNYWNHNHYLGFGPSAHSFWNNKRCWNIKDIHHYIEKLSNRILPIDGEEHLDTSKLMEEFIFLGLRSEGINLKRFEERFHKNFLFNNRAIIDNLIRDGYATLDKEKFKLTGKGYMICDEICRYFFN